MGRSGQPIIWTALGIALCLAQPLAAQITEEEMRALQSKLPPASNTEIDFSEHIRPILESACIRCHGPEEPKGRYRLDNRAAALRGGEHGIDIVPGQSARSPLIYYVAGLVEDMEMPPTGKDNKPLDQEQVSLLRAWIDQGLPWTEKETDQFVSTVTPAAQWFSVTGDERKFGEHIGMKDG